MIETTGNAARLNQIELVARGGLKWPLEIWVNAVVRDKVKAMPSKMVHPTYFLFLRLSLLIQKNSSAIENSPSA